MKKRTLQRLCEEISQHLIGRAMFDTQLTGLHLVFHVKISQVNMFCSFTAGSLAIVF
jgi:hypothetical protein